MAEHDYAVGVDKCPRCVELRSLVHDTSLPPSQCPACIEFRRERSRPSQSAHVPGIGGIGALGLGGLVVHPKGAHASLPTVRPASVVLNDGHARAARQAVERVRAEAAAMRAVAASWDAAITEINRLNRSPSGTVSKR
jgi:hypothetical protein